MQGMADQSRKDSAASFGDDIVLADSLLQEALAILDAGQFDRAAAYVDMARQTLSEATAFRPR